MNPRKPYPTDLTDAQWSLIKDLFSERPAGIVGRPREYSYREIVNAILYLLRTGCQWRNLPHDFPPYTLVSSYYHRWRKRDLVARIHDALRTQVRRHEGRAVEPSVLLVDSQSVKTTEKGGPSDPGESTSPASKSTGKTIGYDAGKHIKGRKRHLAVDTLGLMWSRHVTAASVQDRVGARELLVVVEAFSTRLKKLYADGAYKGVLRDIASDFYGWELEIVHKLPDQKGFVVLPKRWIVERTFAWMSKHRRLSKDYEFQPHSSEAMLDWAMIAHMLRRLTKPHT